MFFTSGSVDVFVPQFQFAVALCAHLFLAVGRKRVLRLIAADHLVHFIKW